MRLLLATFSHETNTFSPVPTKLERFCRDGTALLRGQDAIDFYRGTGTCMGGYLAVADEIGAEVVVPVCASAPPSGPVDSDAYETCCRLITDAVAQGGFDALWLDLHGAMVTDRFDDGEGELLRRIRAIDAKTPICVAYDMHANVFDAMVSNAHDRHRLSDLSAHRSATDRGTRGARIAAGDAGRGAADRGVGFRADAAARDGAGHAPGAQQGPAGDCARRGRTADARSPPVCSSASRTRMWRWQGCRRSWSPTTIATPRRRWSTS